jgi:CrcB protein
MTVLVWLGAAALGGAGALLRFALDGIVAGRLGRDLPAGTFAVNVSGACVLGLVTGATLAGDALLLVGTALLGSYTTFSTWMLETQRLAEEGELAAAVANCVVSLAVGFAAVALGRTLT